MNGDVKVLLDKGEKMQTLKRIFRVTEILLLLLLTTDLHHKNSTFKVAKLIQN